jgi:predicted alpha/beta-fold hydrolase
LGSNAALKALGDLGEQALDRYNIRGASLLCTPFDQEVNARALARPGVNRAVYTNSLLKKMKAKAQEQLDRFCGGDKDTHRFDFTRAMAAETITEFDDAFIAPIYGFTDCWDYYRKTSSIYVLQDVKVPTYILNANDGTWHVRCFEICVVQKTHLSC